MIKVEEMLQKTEFWGKLQSKNLHNSNILTKLLTWASIQ